MPAPGDLVHQTSITAGTGAQTLVAVSGKRTFLQAFGTGGTNTFDYYISHRTTAEHERGTGHESGGTLVRDTVLANHLGTTALVNFTAGVKDITNDVPADQRVLKDLAQTLTNKTLTSPTLNSPTLTTPALGTPGSGVLTNCNGLPIDGGTINTLPIGRGGTGAATALAAFNALSPLTTQGDIIFRDASNNVRLAKGTAGHHLMIGANDPAWVSPNHGFFHVVKNTDQAGLTAGSTVKILFPTEIADVNSYFDNGANSRYQPTVAGRYYFVLSAWTYHSTADTVDTGQCSLRKNGADVFQGNYESHPTAVSGSSMNTVSGAISLNGSTDYVEGFMYVPLGGNTIRGTAAATYMMGWKIGE